MDGHRRITTGLTHRRGLGRTHGGRSDGRGTGVRLGLGDRHGPGDRHGAGVHRGLGVRDTIPAVGTPDIIPDIIPVAGILRVPATDLRDLITHIIIQEQAGLTVPTVAGRTTLVPAAATIVVQCLAQARIPVTQATAPARQVAKFPVRL